jgi:hypothetical protein
VSGIDIFLSYARHDRATARLFAETLAEEGFSVWWDAALHSGETFDEVIERNLREAGAVIVLWSPRSVASRWVRAEATLADRRNKLAPAIIEPCDRPIIFELTHAADLCEWDGDTTDVRWRTFVDDLRRLVAARRADEHAQQATATPPTPARQPLRPGNDEVILAGPKSAAARLQRTPVRQAPAEDPLSPPEVHCLEVEEGELQEQLIVVDSSAAKIGRTAPADIVLPHRSISREHCIVGLANDVLLVTDLNSTNGTYIDGVRVNHATILPVGSVLKLGEISLRHSIRPDAEDGRGNGGMQPGRLAAAS